ncbi:MAG TPA: hypothetical protein VFU86_08650 [Terriglobales bacterium]|nr:hypothetical protein [Terriglobales bacterium]
MGKGTVSVVARAAGLLLLASAGLGAQQRAWKAGDFRGLVAGKSTRKDVVRVLGTATPKQTAHLEIFDYPGKGDFGSRVIVEVNRATGLVATVTERFAPNITRTQARKKYGERYNEVQYSVSDCPQEGVNAPAYRDPKGPIGLIEYPQQGLVLWPNEEGFDIAAALYLPKPMPGKKPVCSKRLAQ